MKYHPHIKLFYCPAIDIWLWGCYMTRQSRHPVIICRDLRKLMASTKRKFERIEEKRIKREYNQAD